MRLIQLFDIFFLFGDIQLLGPTKVEARNSFLFTEKYPCIENKENLVDSLLHLGKITFSPGVDQCLGVSKCLRVAPKLL